MSGARGVVAVQEAQWVAHLRRTLKEAVAETLHERPRPEKPSAAAWSNSLGTAQARLL